MVFDLILASILNIQIANAGDCNNRPVGFGWATLHELSNSVNQTYDVKQHCEK